MLGLNCILVPWWIRDHIENSDMKYSDLFDFNEIKKHLSPLDITDFVAFQGHYLYNKVSDFEISSVDSIKNFWYSSLLLNTNNPLDNRKKQILFENIFSNTNKKVEDFLLNESLDPTYIPKENFHSFTIAVLNEKQIIVVVEKEYKNAILNKDIQFQLLTGLINVYYTFCKKEDVNKSYLFTNYLKILNNLLEG